MRATRNLAACLLLLLATACGGGAHARSVLKAVHQGATPATAPSAGAAPAAAATPSAAGSAGGSPGPAPAAAPVPGPLKLPLAGTYHQNVNRNGSTSTVTEKYSVGSTSNGMTTVTTTDSTDNGGQLINTYSWRPDGIYLITTTVVGSNGQREDCTYNPPIEELPLPIRIGNHWSSSGSCSTPAPYASTTNLHLSATVTGAAWQTIGGTRVATYDIQGTLDTDTSGTYTGGSAGGIPIGPTPYDVKTTSQLTIYLDPPAGLQVHDIANTTSVFNGKSSTTTTDTQMQSLRPS